MLSVGRRAACLARAEQIHRLGLRPLRSLLRQRAIERDGQSPEQKHQVLFRISALTSLAIGLYLFSLRPEQGSQYSSPFVVSKVVENVDSTPNTKLITLTLPRNFKIPSNPIWSVFVKDSDIQVERPYTPIGIDGHNVKLWVKKYPHGEVGRWLHAREAGSNLEIRGPVETWRWDPGQYDEIVMLSGGTGITPFVQLLTHNIQSPSKTRFKLLHSSRSVEDLPPPELLEPLRAIPGSSPGQFELRLFTDEHGTSSNADVTTGRRISPSDILQPHTSSRWWWTARSSAKIEEPVIRRAYLVCGPPGFVAAMAGPRSVEGQGTLGGYLAELGVDASSVHKFEY